MQRFTGASRLTDLTEAALITWCTHGNPANNTVYSRSSTARIFFKWCLREGLIDSDPAAQLRDPDSPIRAYRRTYGKVQSKNPGRWLSAQEAYERLIPAADDGTAGGLRNQIVLRLGLSGLRVKEIADLKITNIAQRPILHWTGKGHKPRRISMGAELMATLDDYLSRYAAALGTLTPDMPLICKHKTGNGALSLNWGKPVSANRLYQCTVRIAERAGLGHVAPHDLRRSAAGMLHNATDEQGAHYFDLLDIQKVLGHSDPATTMRSYLEPMQTDVLDRAAQILR